ncbi:MAG: putative protein serine/threonine kinase [Streblomastix strix]|uniref:non-specific serine/threonine protein kinase n=1 Tax=Streblomastix strix TaxID=222440 RepID=A0A5J4X1I0_9EUKA|nr:MAG: putative protein serine/threonine kinase [Streblomastix strix]
MPVRAPIILKPQWYLNKEVGQGEKGNPSPLGAGAWGRVYRAQDLYGQLLAIKVQKLEEYLDSEFAAAGILENIPTPYFVKTFGKKELGDRVFIAMEYADMGSLEKTTDACLMPRVIIIAHDLLEFLSHLHRNFLVHCNIKPSNIVLAQVEYTDNFIPKMCDFGESAGMEMMKTSLDIGGSPFFHPPEVRNKKGNYDGGVDIWGLGIVLYLLATGKSMNHPRAFFALRQYGLVLPSDLQMITEPPTPMPHVKQQELNIFQQDLLLDKNGVHLKDTMGKDFLQLLSLMLTVDPTKRPTAAQLLMHPVFTMADNNITSIPISYANELGIQIDLRSQLVSARVRPGIQISKIQLEKQVTLNERLNQEQAAIRQQFGLEVDEIIAKLMINDAFANFATIEDLYAKLQEYEDQQLHFMISKDIIQALTNATIRCIFDFAPNTPLTQSGQSFYRNKSQNYIESDQRAKILLIRSHYSYMIAIFVDIQTKFKRGRERVKQIFADTVLQELLVSFLEPIYNIQKEFLEALDNTIPFFAPEQVRDLVKSKELILYLSQAAVMFSKVKPDITNLAIKILAAVAKHGIKLGEGAQSFSVTSDNFVLLLQQAESGGKVDITETKEHPFKQYFERSGSTANIALIFNQTIEKLEQYKIQRDYVAKGGPNNSSIYRDPKVDMTLKLTDGSDPENPEEQLLYTRLASSACIVLFHNGSKLQTIHQRVIEVLIEEIFPPRLEQSLKDINLSPEHKEMMEKRLNDASIAIIALGYLLHLPANYVFGDKNSITGNIQKFLMLSEMYPEADVVHALSLLSVLARSTPNDQVIAAINSVMISPEVAKIRQLQVQRKEVDVIEKLNILEIVLTKFGYKQQKQELPSLGSNYGSGISQTFSQRMERLGKGGFGEVWKAKVISSGQLVAYKELAYYSDEEKQMAFPSSFLHVVEPLGFFVEDEEFKAYLVLECCSNGDLRQYINQMMKMGVEISDKKAWEMVGQVIESLNQLHANGIIHGDMKPENILLTEDFEVKLADFGLTKKLQEGREYITAFGGTTRYLSPELQKADEPQQNGKSQQKRMQTKAADIWAEKNISLGELVLRVTTINPPEIPTHYPESLRKLIKGMLEKDPSRRITSEQILKVPEVAESLKKE